MAIFKPRSIPPQRFDRFCKRIAHDVKNSLIRQKNIVYSYRRIKDINPCVAVYEINSRKGMFGILRTKQAYVTTYFLYDLRTQHYHIKKIYVSLLKHRKEEIINEEALKETRNSCQHVLHNVHHDFLVEKHTGRSGYKHWRRRMDIWFARKFVRHHEKKQEQKLKAA
ncbi:MAG: hypothetical protein ACMXYE_01565 [Candidatus Woesearchaeota archaeon]